MYDRITTRLPFGIIVAHNVTEGHLRKVLRGLREKCALAITEDIEYAQVKATQPDAWCHFVRPIKGQTAMSQTVRASVLVLCAQNRFTRAFYRTLVWLSRSRHVTFVLGNWPPWRPKSTCLAIVNCLWELGWYYDPPPGANADWVRLLFSTMEGVKVPSRFDLHKALQAKSFPLPPNVAVHLGIRATHSRFPWRRSEDVVMRDSSTEVLHAQPLEAEDDAPPAGGEEDEEYDVWDFLEENHQTKHVSCAIFQSN